MLSDGARYAAVALVVAACTPAETPTIEQAAPPTVEPVADPGIAVVPETAAPPPTPPPPPPEPVVLVDASPVAGQNWLVWFEGDAGWTTRWIVASSPEPKLGGERLALVTSDGVRLWRIERHDADVAVHACECMDDDGELRDGCAAESRLATPGLRAIALADGSSTTLVEPDRSRTFGEGVTTSLDIHGGAGSKLFVEWSMAGYLCGAHEIEEGAFQVLDVATGKEIGTSLADIGAGLPKRIRREAKESARGDIEQCHGDDPESLRDTLAEPPILSRVTVQMRERVPTILWQYEVGLPYMCASDYAAHGDVESDLIPQARALGLTPPLPPAILAAIADLPDSTTVGWARLELSGTAAHEALVQFRSVPAAPWPSADAETREAEVVADSPQAKLDEARRLTRAKEYAAAIARFDEVLALDATMAAARSGRGYAAMLSGDYERARADFDAALELDDDPRFQAAVHFNRGLLAERQGDATAAATAYGKSLALRPNKQVRAALERIAASK